MLIVQSCIKAMGGCLVGDENVFFFLTQQPNAGQGRLILEVYRSHAITHYSQ